MNGYMLYDVLLALGECVTRKIVVRETFKEKV